MLLKKDSNLQIQTHSCGASTSSPIASTGLNTLGNTRGPDQRQGQACSSFCQIQGQD